MVRNTIILYCLELFCLNLSDPRHKYFTFSILKKIKYKKCLKYSFYSMRLTNLSKLPKFEIVTEKNFQI